MAIKITNADDLPALKYENFFLEDLRLTQEHEDDDTKPPKYTLRVQYRLFAVDTDNKRHFKTKISHIVIEDYLALAMQKYASGDPDLAQAMGAIEIALAQIIADQTDLGNAEVS